MKDYQKSFTVNKPANDVYGAITLHIADWWSNDMEGAAARPGDRYNIAFNNTRKTFKITEAIPNERVVWKCEKAYIDSVKLENKSEWVGTTLTWTINSAGESSTLTFLHEGLNPELQCYNICESGWDYFLASLKTYLETGKGTPFLKAEKQSAG